MDKELQRLMKRYPCLIVEAESDEVCEKYVDSVIEVIKAKGHIGE